MFPRRLLTPSSNWSARLVAGSNTSPLTSVSAEFARTLAPAAPPSPPPHRSLRVDVDPASDPSGSPRSRAPARVREPIALPRSSPISNERLIEPAPPPRTPRRADDDDDDTRLDAVFLQALARARAAKVGISVQQAVADSHARAGTVVNEVELAWESTPSAARRIETDSSASATESSDGTTQDGIVLVAHVVGGPDPKVVISSGFAVANAQTILTCFHTLARIEGHLSKRVTEHAPSPPSATFVLVSSGHIYPVSSVLSSLPESDLLLLELAPTPLGSPTRRHGSEQSCPALRPLPINPYPSPPRTVVSTHTYLNPLSRLRRKFDGLGPRVWRRCEIVEYHDAVGRTAVPGTYDELASFWFDQVPTSGSSGGPIVEVESGTVVGVTRGSMHKYGERTRYGFATPAERILDMFTLPGFKSTADRDRDRERQRRIEIGSAGTSVDAGKGEPGER